MRNMRGVMWGVRVLLTIGLIAFVAMRMLRARSAAGVSKPAAPPVVR